MQCTYTTYSSVIYIIYPDYMHKHMYMFMLLFSISTHSEIVLYSLLAFPPASGTASVQHPFNGKVPKHQHEAATLR